LISVRRYLVNMIVTVLPPTRAFGFKRFLWRKIGVAVGHRTKINSGAKVWGVGPVSIGSQCWLGMNLVLIVPDGAKVTIGSDVDIGPDVLIECGSHDIGGPDRRAGTERATSVHIGAGSWIGCRVTILGGAKLAPGTIVGAGALVLPGEYPENSLLTGVPARVSRILGDSESCP
jgi:maltose O-acetyltransferase